MIIVQVNQVEEVCFHIDVALLVENKTFKFINTKKKQLNQKKHVFFNGLNHGSNQWFKPANPDLKISIVNLSLIIKIRIINIEHE